MKKLRYLQTDEPVEDCETVYPQEVVTTIEAEAEITATETGTTTTDSTSTTGTDDTIDAGTTGGDVYYPPAYYAPLDLNSGMYYPPELPEPEPEVVEVVEEIVEEIDGENVTTTTTTTEVVEPDPIPEPEVGTGTIEDPAVLVPDVEEPAYYTEVDTTLLNLYEPQVYEPIETTREVEVVDNTTGEVTVVEEPIEVETNTPENTTAYVVTITTCPEIYYEEITTEITDPGADNIYEASAIIKHEVCDSYETAAAGTRNLQDGTVTGSEEYTM